MGRRNTDEIISLYTDNSVFIAPGCESSVGTASLKSSYIRVFSNIKLTIEFELLEIVNMFPELAFTRTTAAGSMVYLKGDEKDHWNQELFVLRKVVDHWKIARY